MVSIVGSRTGTLEYAPGIVIHDNGHTRHAQTVRLRHHALPETVCDMIRAEQTSDDDEELDRYKPKCGGIPVFECLALEIQVPELASRENAARIACLTNCRFDERREISTALKLVLDAESALRAEVL